MRKISVCFILALVLPLVPARAQLTIDLQQLAQGEIRNGGIINTNATQEDNVEDRANFIISRSRITVNYKLKGLEMNVTPQYTYIWGQRNFGTFHMFEAWAKYTAPFGLFVQVGRQAISYDDERILGPNDWAMAAMSHDVLRLGYEGHGHKAQVFVAYNQNPENTEGGVSYVGGAQPYKTMQTAWYHYDVPGIPLGASILFMNIGAQAALADAQPHLEYQQLIGGHLSFKPEWGEFSASYYHQLGRNEYNIPIDAWMAAVKASGNPTPFLKISAGYDYLSGDPYFAVPGKGHVGVTFHDKIRGFSSLYGSHHKFYGLMDFFYVSTYVNGFSPGLQNAYAGVSVTLFEKLTLGAAYHYLATATRLKDLEPTLGHCAELDASYKFTDYISIMAGFSYMTGTKTMERLKRASNQGNICWGWLTLIINPRILNYSK